MCFFSFLSYKILENSHRDTLSLYAVQLLFSPYFSGKNNSDVQREPRGSFQIGETRDHLLQFGATDNLHAAEICEARFRGMIYYSCAIYNVFITVDRHFTLWKTLRLHRASFSAMHYAGGLLLYGRIRTTKMHNQAQVTRVGLPARPGN